MWLGPFGESRTWILSVCVCVCLWSQWSGWKIAEWRWNMTKLLVLLSMLIPGNWLHYVLLQLLLKSCKVTPEGMPKVLVCLFFWSPSPHCGPPDKYGTAVPFLRNDFYSFKTSLSNFFFFWVGGGYDCVFSALLCFALFFNLPSFSTICPLKQDYATFV